MKYRDRMTVDSGTAPTRLERRKERTRQAMIDAAQRIVAERGTVSVTITGDHRRGRRRVRFLLQPLRVQARTVRRLR